MSDAIDVRPTRRELAGAQLLAVYLIGCLTLPLGGVVFVSLIFGGPGVAGPGLLLLLAGTVGLIFFAGTSTKRGCPATATAGRRFWWAVAITVGGAAGVGASAWLTVVLDVEYEGMEPWIPVAGLPYLLVAAAFLGGRIRLVALLVLVTLIGGAVYALQDQVRKEDAEAQRDRVLALLQAPVDLIYAAEISGYRSMVPPISASTAYEPVDQSAVRYWREQDIVVTVSHTAVQGPDCGPDPLLTPAPPPDLGPSDAPTGTPAPARPSPSEVSCVAEGSSLHYRRGGDAHEYIRTAGDTVIRAGAGTVVAKELLKEAVVTARPLSMDELEQKLFGG